MDLVASLWVHLLHHIYKYREVYKNIKEVKQEKVDGNKNKIQNHSQINTKF